MPQAQVGRDAFGVQAEDGKEAGVPEWVKDLAHSEVTPSESEKLRIAGVLQRAVSDLFPEVAA